MKGAKQKFRSFGSSSKGFEVWAIHWAAALGHENIIKMLVNEYDADVNQLTEGGQSPLMIALFCTDRRYNIMHPLEYPINFDL